MEKNILLESTVEIFENGVKEINRLKKSIIDLNSSIVKLNDFEELLDIQIDPGKVRELEYAIKEVLEKNKNCLNSFDQDIKMITQQNEDSLRSIKLQIEDFVKESNELKESLNDIKYDFDKNIKGSLTKSVNKLKSGLDNKYKDIGKKHEIIESLIVDLGNKCNDTFNRLDKLIFSEVTNENIIEEIKILNNNTYKERFNQLEEKINYLIKENKELKEIQKKENVFNQEFKAEIFELIKKSIEKILRNNNDSYENKITEQSNIINNQNYKEADYTLEELQALKREAKLEKAEDCFKLGEIYYKGIGVEKNIDQALDYYKIGVKKNHPQSKERIINIYKEEAQRGDGKYQRLLALEYYSGDLIEKNIEKSRYWLKEAIKNGNSEAKILSWMM